MEKQIKETEGNSGEAGEGLWPAIEHNILKGSFVCGSHIFIGMKRIELQM